MFVSYYIDGVHKPQRTNWNSIFADLPKILGGRNLAPAKCYFKIDLDIVLKKIFWLETFDECGTSKMGK